MTEVTKDYPGSQQVLYLATDTITANVRKRLANFFEFKELYTEAFLTSVEQKRINAALLPDEAMRAMGHDSVRDVLVIVAAVCLKRFRSLKRYIATAPAFSSNKESFWNACGWRDHYAAAANDSWQDVSALCEASIKFISDHLPELSAGHNMPAGFPQQFIDSFADYTTTFNLFEQRLEAARTGTEAKLIANNDLYHTVIDFFCLDGSHIFEDSFAISKEYSYEAVSEMLSPSGPSAIAVETVKDEGGVEVAMPSVDISIVGTSIHETTNGEGHAEINRIANGPVRMLAKADGFKDQIIDITLDGTRKQVKIVMAPLFAGEMKVGVSQEPGVRSSESAVGSMQEAGGSTQAGS
ncbi:MAG: hypothetical protein ABI855_11085 [Bacteroidota bacterium]